MAALTKTQLNRIMERIAEIKKSKHEQIEQFVYGAIPPCKGAGIRTELPWLPQNLTPDWKKIDPEQYPEWQRPFIEDFNEAFIAHHLVSRQKLESAAKALKGSTAHKDEIAAMLCARFDELVQEAIDRLVFVDRSDIVNELKGITEKLNTWTPSL